MSGQLAKIEIVRANLDGRGELALAPEEESRARQIADPRQRGRYERTRGVVRAVLAEKLGVAPGEVIFEITPGGKPAVAGVEFSISHSGPHLVIALAERPVGIDIETRSPREAERLAERFFSAGDAARVARDAAEFPRQWVAKEAALKAAGLGLAGGLERARCRWQGAEIVGVEWDSEGYAIREFRLGDATPGAVAWAAGVDAELSWRDFPG